MKYTVLLFFLSIGWMNFKAQTFNQGYLDGKVYAKFNKMTLKTILSEDARNIPLNKVNFLVDLYSKYNITQIVRPFANASDDNDLPYILRIEFSNKNLVEELIVDLEKMKTTIYAEKVPLAKVDAVPNDPLFLTAGGGNHLNQINAQNAWNLSTGNPSITVAIVDNAVMWTHADLVANTYTNTGEIANNGLDDDGNGYVDDVNGFDVANYDNNAVPTNTNMFHGTHCAGIAAATTNNNIGISGIGWNIKFIPVKCETDNGSVSSVTYGYEGIIYAVKAKAKVISCSWTNLPNVSSVSEQSVMNYAWNRGCIIIACAGNYATNTPHYPGAYNNVYCVAAVDNSDIKAPYSNFGSWVDVAAPGTTIQSTVPYLGSPVYQQQSGTSMSTPLVAGLAGLILSKAPDMTRTNVLNCLSSSATNIYTLTGNSSYASGNQLGAGRIDAYQALLCASNYTALAPQANFYAFPKSACPNTAINFYDSSNYVPTSWNWTFQGGTPANSTLSNPIVQWNTAGTYSVSLTVSNSSGNNSITKQSYITISNPLSINPFTEGFQAATFLPNGWTAKNIFNDEMFWQRVTGVGAYGTSNACAMFNNSEYIVSGERDEMRTPKFNFTSVAKVKLKFDVAYARYDAVFSDSLEVKLSSDCGLNWTSIYLKGGTGLATSADFSNGTFTPTASQWRTDSIDITTLAAGQGNIMFSFINRGHFGQALYLDNINLFFPVPQLNVNFNSIVCISSSQQFSNTSSGGLNYNWSFQGGTPSVSTISNPTVSYSNIGNYLVTLYATNGPISTMMTNTIQVINSSNIIPIVSYTNAACITCTNGAININTSGGMGNYTYSWTPNVSSNNFANNLAPGCYSIQISDLSGCSSQTSVCVSFADGLSDSFKSMEDIFIFPNPAKDNLTIASINDSFDFKIINQLGQVLHFEKNVEGQKTITIDHFSKGIYLIEINKMGHIIHKKIIFN